MLREKSIFENKSIVGYQNWLDALRGIAAIFVVFSHYIWTPYTEQEGIWHYILSPGVFGVALFFCISGYVIPFSVSSLKSPELPRFMIFRAFRLYPVYWVAIIFAAVMYSPTIKELVMNLTMVQRFIGGHDILSVAWTLQVELVFYAIVAAIIAFPKARSSQIVSVVFILMAVLSITGGYLRYAHNIKAPVGLTNGLAVMMFSWIYFYKPEFYKEKHLLPLWAAVFVLCLMAASWFMAYAKDWGSNEVPFWSAFTQVFNYTLALFVFYFVVRKPFNAPGFLLWLGKISYSLYLVHVPIRTIADHVVDPYLGQLGGALLATIGSIVLASALYVVVERPMIKAGRKLATGLFDTKVHT